jgi:hypothetical protein
VTSTPVLRGRWQVVDYPDQTDSSPSSKSSKDNVPTPKPPQTSAVAVAASMVAYTNSTAAAAPIFSIGPEAADKAGSEVDASSAAVRSSNTQPYKVVTSVSSNAAVINSAEAAASEVRNNNLTGVRTVPNNLHNMGAKPQASESSASMNSAVVTNHHTYPGPQVFVLRHNLHDAPVFILFWDLLGCMSFVGDLTKLTRFLDGIRRHFVLRSKAT